MKIHTAFAILVFYYISECLCEDCGSHEFMFDGKGSYLTYLGTLPEVDVLTICQYLTSNSNGGFLGALRSYSTTHQPGAFYNYAKMTEKGEEMIFYKNGKTLGGPITFPPNKELFLCQIINSLANEIELVINSSVRRSMKPGEIGPIPQGGELRIGRTHDEALPLTYKGKMRNVMMWGRRLTAKEIDDMHKQNICPTDKLVGIRNTNVRFHGNFFPQADCVDADYTLNNTGAKVEYIKVTKSLPTSESLTICAWITTDAVGMIPGTVGSYAVGKDVDVLLAVGEMMDAATVLKVVVKGQIQTIAVPLAGNTEHSFCLLYNLMNSKVMAYLNGDFVADINFSYLGPITGGGSIIVGQRQECLGGCFEKDKAYTGKIRDFTVWGRLLSDDEIKSLVDSNKCPTDHVIDTTSDNVVIHKSP